MPPKHTEAYTHFADLVTRYGDRTRFHWTPHRASVLVIKDRREPASTKTISTYEARRLWRWLINAGWEPYGIPLIGRGSQRMWPDEDLLIANAMLPIT